MAKSLFEIFERRGVRRVARKSGGLAATLLALSLLIPGQDVLAQTAVCGAVPIYTNTGSGVTDVGGSAELLQTWSPSGALLSSVPLSNNFGDIAINSTGTDLYAVGFAVNEPFVRRLYRIDPATGTEISSIAMSGDVVADGVEQLNSLAFRADGTLLMGGGVTNIIYVVDPTTGATTRFSAAFPAGIASAGDFITLPDGDILASGADYGSGQYFLYRIKPDNSTFPIGEIPVSFGAAMSDGNVYLIGSTGQIHRVDATPALASTAPLPITTIVNTSQSFYGATSALDAGGSSCDPSLLTLRKTWIGAVVGDAVTVQASLGGATVDSLNSIADSISETDTDTTPITVYAGDVITFAETFTVGDPAQYGSVLACTGNQSPLSGASLTIVPADTDIVCTYTNARPTVTYGKASSTTGPVAVGDTITYTLTATVANAQLQAPLTLTDTLGVGLTLANVTPTAPFTCNSTSPLVCSLPAATAPGNYTVSYTASVNAQATGTVRNVVVGDQGSCDADCDVDIPVSAPLVAYHKSANTAGPVAVGDIVTYTLTATIANAQLLAPLTLTDTPGTGLTLTTATPTGPFTCNSASPLVCTLPATTVPGTYTLSYTATVNAQATGAVANVVVADQGSCDADCDVEIPVETPTASYHKTANTTGPVSVGDTITYTLTATIIDAQLLSPLNLTDTLGRGLTLGTVTPAAPFTCNSATPLVCTLPATTLPGTYTVSYTATVNAQATGTVANTVVGDQGSCDADCTIDVPVDVPTVTYHKAANTAGPVSVGDIIVYTLQVDIVGSQTTDVLTLADTLGVGLDRGAVTAGVFTCGGANPMICTLPLGTGPGSYTISYEALVNSQAREAVTNTALATGNDAPSCATSCDTRSPVVAPRVVVTKTSDPGSGARVELGQTVRYTLSITVSDSALTQELVLEDTPDPGLTLSELPSNCLFNGGVLVCRLPAGTPVGTSTLSYNATVNANAGQVVANQVVASGGGGDAPLCTSCSTEHELAAPEIRLSKSAGTREIRIGDLVRYTLTVENVGSVNLVNGNIVDSPPAGFTYVEGSLLVRDADGMATVSGNQPLRIAGVDVRAGEIATLVYVMRVGAGVRPGAHINEAQVRNAADDPVSNVATAEVALTADALIDDSLLMGTVFNDRDGDGWQDSAALSGVKVQGGFAPGAYIANSTTVDRGAGPQPEPDASSPMLHGIALGKIAGRQSVAEPLDTNEVVIRQRLSDVSFTGDFVLTSDQGVTVRMDAAGNTRVEQSGDAAKGLNAAAPTVERRVSQGEGGYVVDYVIRNTGIDERGIPGVRIASVEGLLIETDQYGRYHLAGVSGGAGERGRNFILKVDPSTLSTGAEFTTDNPLLRRITPGVPVRFDFGVKLPEQVIEGGDANVELEMGEVLFAPGSAEVRTRYLAAIEQMAAKVREHQGGEVVIIANGDDEGLAFDRANAVKEILLGKLDAVSAERLVVSVRGTVDDPGSMIVGVDEGGALLGTVLFDTDKSAIRPEFEALLDRVSAALERLDGGSITIVGHTDVRASHAYNTALGMRRAKAVYEALAKRLSPEVRAKVRVESSSDPTVPVGVRK